MMGRDRVLHHEASVKGGSMAAFRRRIVFIAFTLFLSLLAMAVSYAMVRWLTLGMEEERVPDPMIQRRAILLRGFANDLTTSCNDYVRVVPNPKGGGNARCR
jgi:hypothetical protein